MKKKDSPAPGTATTTTPKVKRHRKVVTVTLSEEAIQMAAALGEKEGQTLSRLIERWIRDSFGEYGMKLPGTA